MKNILTGLLLLCLIVNNQPLKGQPLELHSTPFGILIKPVGEQSVEGLYLYRKANNRGKFKQVSLWPAVSAKSVYDQKISFYNKLFVTAGIEPAMADSLWQIYQNGTSLAEQIKNPVFLLATGKAVLDTLVELGKSYQYQLQDGNEQAGSTSRRLFYPETADMPVPRLLTSDGKGPFPHLTWFALGGEDWADFKVYRNSARNQDFELIRPQQLIYRKAESDTIYFQIRDTGLQDEGMWQYYIQAVDIYENKGTATRPVSCLWMPRYSKPAARMLKVIPQEDRRGNLLGWSLYNPERVQSIAIYKSRTAEGPFRKIATVAPSDSTYYDPVAIAMEPNFYYLEINDIGGESSRSAIVHGIVKARTVPEQPQLVRAEAVENGIRISWIQDGPTTSGFYLYRAEGYRDSLVQISGLIEAPCRNCEFVDSSAVLKGGQTYSYALKAESDTYHQSEFSERVYAICGKPTFISSPRKVETRFRNNAVQITWENILPRETYLKGYQVFRRVEGQQDFEQISTTLLHPRQNRFSDSTFLTNARYEYVIKAYDDFGAESAFSITSSIQLENYVQLFSEHISARRTPEGILVKWTPSAQPRLLKEWRIYRAKNGENYQLQATLEGSLLDYSDLAVQKDAFYSYIVIAVDHSGTEHPAEQPVSLKY